MTKKKTQEMFDGIRRDAKAVSAMSEDWLVNIMSTAGKDLRAVRAGIDDLLRYEEVLNGTGVSRKQTVCESALAGATVKEAGEALLANFHGSDAAKLIKHLTQGYVASEAYGECADDLARFQIDQAIRYLGPESAALAAGRSLKVDMDAWQHFKSTMDRCLEVHTTLA